MSRRILHVDHSPVLGGAERSVLSLATAQRARGDRPTLAIGRSGPFADAARTAGLAVRDLDWPARLVGLPERASPLRSLALVREIAVAVRRLRRAIAAVDPDVVHSHTRKAHLLAALAVPRRRRFVVHLRDAPPASGWVRLALRLAVRRADHAVALTAWVAEAHLRRGIRPRSGRIDLVPSSVDPEPLRGLPTPWLDGQRPPVLGFVGQLAAWKAPHLLVEALEALDDQPDLRAVIVGDVWFGGERGYGEWLEARIARSPVRDRIVRLGSRDPAAAFAAFDVLVHTSARPEPFGRVLVEAMLAGRPIVGIRHGSLPELLDGTTASLADEPSAGALAAAIRDAVADPVAARDRAERARRRADAFRPDVVADRMADAYDVADA